jgi:REP element-mobilizing transposase RayT
MQTASGLPIRKRLRLAGFHYAGDCSYYVTICAHRKKSFFGTCRNGAVDLNDTGKIVAAEWLNTFATREAVIGDDFIVMPNHLHGLITIHGTQRDGELGRIIGAFKSAATSRVRKLLGDATVVLWQPRFHDRIVRNDREYEALAVYIADNPRRWCARRDASVGRD